MVRRINFIMKKILSTFMSFILLTSSLSTPIFAEYDDILTLPIEYSKRNKIPTKPSRGKSESSIRRKRQVVQKAFLVALLCSQNIDVEVDFNSRNSPAAYNNFLITKIGESVVYTKGQGDNAAQIKSIQQYISENISDIKFDLVPRGIAIACANVNGYLLNQNTIYKIGEKVLEIIENKRQNLMPYKIYCVNLKEDASFVREVSNILGNLLENDTDRDESKLELFELPSNSQRLEPITNPVHVNYLKEHPENSSLITACYQKTFLVAILSTFGINISINPQIGATDKNFPECFKLSRIGKKYLQTIGTYCHFLTIMIKLINEIVPARKLKIETVSMTYSIPARVTINNKIVLNENDVFNLGQRFYNLIYDMLSKETLKPSNPCYLIHLYQSDDFIQGVKKIFKEYTGKNLPNIKL